MICRFGEFELDESLFELRRNGQPVAAEPKVFNVLAYLLKHRERVIPKDELFARLWPGEFVSDSALTSCIKALRKVLGDDGTTQRLIKTVHGRGYRFVGRVTSDQLPVTSDEKPEAAVTTRTDFVGREREIEQLTAGLDEALSGRARMFLLVGEPGIGKTRTADEIAARARQRRACVLVGRCHEGDGAPAFWPWVQVVRAYLRERDPAAVRAAMGPGATDIAQVVPEVRVQLPDLPALPVLAAAQGRFRLFDSVATFIKNAGRVQPQVIVIDDLHWADTASLLLLQFVARELGDARLLIIATYRDEDLGRHHALTQALGELARVDGCQRIELRGLDMSDVARCIERTCGTAVPASLVAAVYDETDGNPFFVTEIVRLLAADGSLAADRRRAMPQTVRDAIGRRIDRLSESCVRTLGCAAVIGREFDQSVLARMWTTYGGAPEPILQGLDEAVAARMIELQPTGIGRYRFVHALIRETLYEGLGASERVRLHRLAGHAIERLYGSRVDPPLAILAHHFFQAAAGGDIAKAIHYAAGAGDRAAGLLAYEEAVDHYGRALQLLDVDGADAAQRCELLLALGDTQWRAGEFAPAKERFQQAAALARGSNRVEQFARAALGFGGGFRGFDLGIVERPLIDLLEEATGRLGAADSALSARVAARLAVALYHLPNSLQRRAQLSQHAVEMAERVGDAAAHLAALYSRHWAIWGPENLDDRLVAADAMVRLAEEVGDREMALHAHRFRLIDFLELGDVHAVDAELAACARLADELRQPYYLWYVATFRAMRALLESRFEECEPLARAALAIGQRAQSQNVSQTFAVQMLWLQREQGQLADLEPALRAFVEQYPTLPSWRCGLTWVLSELGRAADAREQFEILAADDFARIPHNAFWLAAVSLLGDVCVALGDARRAAPLYELLLPYALRNVEVTLGAACMGSVSRVLGRLAALLERWAEMERHFVDALELEQRLGSRHLVAHTQHDHAAALVARDQRGDVQRAVHLLVEAQATYEALGLSGFRDQAAAVRHSAEAAIADARTRSRVTVLRPR